MLLPVRLGNSNRSDLSELTTSLLAQRGDAITTEVGSIIWIEMVAIARAIYKIWAINTKLINQFNPLTLTDFLDRWESMLNLTHLPNDTIQQRRLRISTHLALINKMPNRQTVIDLLIANLGKVFVGLINTSTSDAAAVFPGAVPIIGGITTVVDGGWLSTCQNIYIEAQLQPHMTINEFYNTINQVYYLLNGYLPAYDKFDWFWNGFSDDGYASAENYVATISTTIGSTTLTGIGTAWATPINPYINRYIIENGSILECYDDNGNWQRMKVFSLVDDNTLTLSSPSLVNITNKRYVIQGFFFDCDSSSFPYPPQCYNFDNAGFNEV